MTANAFLPTTFLKVLRGWHNCKVETEVHNCVTVMITDQWPIAL